MLDKFSIAGYCRISVDEEQDRDNTSIENQKAIIEDLVKHKFPGSKLTLYEDRDRSGYTFEQRENYQKMRGLMLDKKYDILIIKDFSRFSRRNSRGLVELEDLRDAGMRIISIGDNVDYPNDDDWLKIQFQFLINEMPVTDASKKVKSVIKRRQTDGKWICAVPYGYVITNNKTMTFEADQTQAEVVRKIFELYNSGWGYRKIANHLTDLHISTPRMDERSRKEMKGEENKIKAKPEWSIVTIEGILRNDFYIGTLRQGKYARKKINGSDVKIDNADHIVFENHHESIVDYRTFAVTHEELKKRTTDCYHGIKINDNIYSGFIRCGDCGEPMFAMSRRDLRPAYTCSSYHKRGLSGCSSHHTRVDMLDNLLKSYIKRVRENSAEMIKELEASINNECNEVKSNQDTIALLEKQLEDAREELKTATRQKVRELMRRPEAEELIEESYGELISECEGRITGIQNQVLMTADKRNTIIRVNRIARTAIDIFDETLEKDKLDRRDLELILDKIIVFEDHIEIKLKTDIDALLKLGTIPVEESVNFNSDTADIENRIVQKTRNHLDKVYRVNVISDGDPLEIYTEKDGEVIFKKYSPVGELSDFAAQICEALYKSGDCVAAVCDRDTVIACAGVPKKELVDKRISGGLTDIMDSRKLYAAAPQTELPFAEGEEILFISVAAPIIAEGDVMGCVVFAAKQSTPEPTEVQVKLAATVASFLGKQMEG